MKKSNIETVLKVMPDAIKTLGDYFKNSLNGALKSFSENTSTIGLVFKIFGQPIVDKYYAKIESNKLSNYGLLIYIKASIIQTGISLEKAVKDINNEYSVDAIKLGSQVALTNHLSRIENSNWVLFFQPKYHPAVCEVVTFFCDFLNQLGVSQKEISDFKKYFFEEIELRIEIEFGPDLYKKHLQEIKNMILQENESKLLYDNIAISKIGFKENEKLGYEETYGELLPVSSLFNSESSVHFSIGEEDLKSESRLKKVDEIIEEYFIDGKNEGSLEKILFLVADFGKGKSVYLKQMACRLSKLYLENSTNYFPVYFNLRNYRDFSDDHFLGVVADFLEIKYGIKISDEYFKNKRYVFLIDSLDESGDLSQNSIDRVVSSVKKIQSVDPVLFKFNRIIVATRPFDGGLKKHLQCHNPFIKKNKQGRPVEYYVSLHGFKKNQFNSWLNAAIKNNIEAVQFTTNSFNTKIITKIQSGIESDIYGELLDLKLVTVEELRRPIFAYMIFQLLINGIDFKKFGKIGIYLSFINLLTKEAKYLHDDTYRINLLEQFGARNVLHATASLWQYNRSINGISEIKKADICRVIEEDVISSNDSIVLMKYNEKGNKDIEFLSHSYFGENNSLLHFQHQSFAEILLAEYYLKILVKYALEEEMDIESARLKLSLGIPTSQCVSFLTDLVVLLKDSIKTGDESYESRKLLFPLLSSLASRSNNKSLNSNYLYYKWFEKFNLDDNTTEPPQFSVLNWPITSDVILKISELCKRILHSENVLSLQAGEYKASLFNNEIFRTKNSKVDFDTDKYLALTIGNVLFNCEEKGLWFNSSLCKSSTIIKLITDRKSFAVPVWARSYFLGLDLSDSQEIIDLSWSEFSRFNFSFSKLFRIHFRHSLFLQVNFDNSEIRNCDFGFARFVNSTFEKSEVYDYHRFALSAIAQGVFFPYKLAEIAWKKRSGNQLSETSKDLRFSGILTNYSTETCHLFNIDFPRMDREFVKMLSSLLKSGYNRKVWTMQQIESSFKFQSASNKESFMKLFKENLKN